MKKKTSNFRRGLSFFDIFGEEIKFNIECQESHGSVFGLLMTLMIFMTISAFGMKKFQVMIEHGDTNHQTIIKKNQLGPQEGLSLKNINVALSATDAERSSVDLKGAFEWEVYFNKYETLEDQTIQQSR